MRKYFKTLADKKVETRVHEVTTTTPPPPPEVHINLCDREGFKVREDFLINYTDLGCQIIVLDISALVSLAETKRLEQYLGDFNLTIEEIELSPCHQFFKFGPSKRYLSSLMVQIPVIVQRNDGRDEVLKIQAYLVDAHIPFLCGKRTLEHWQSNINTKRRILETEIDRKRRDFKMMKQQEANMELSLRQREIRWWMFCSLRIRKESSLHSRQ